MNLSLWAVPARIVWGNSLSQEVFASWHTPFYAPPYQENVGEAAEDTAAKSSKDQSSENGLEQSA